jgi:hypothetical protein
MSNITVKSGDRITIAPTQPGYNRTTVVSQPVRNQIDIAGLKGGGDKNYIHLQNLPSATWVVSHNLGKKPSVTVVDSADEVVFGEVHYDSDNQVTLTFAGAFSGKAYFN